MDYLFVTKKGVFEQSELQTIPEEEVLKVLVVRDDKSKALFAHAVPMKGVDEKNFIVQQVVKRTLRA